MPSVELSDRIYVPGGFGGERAMEAYDPATDTWQELPSMPGARHHLMAAAHGGRLYLFGGGAGLSFNATEDAWVFDPAAGVWDELPAMPEPRFAGAAVALGDSIYIVGGTGGSGGTLVFRPQDSTWSTLPAPAHAREHVAGVAFDQTVWALGGRWGGVGELASVEIFRPARGDWASGPPMLVPRAGFAAAVVDGRIVVAGGEVIMTGRETLGSVEIFDPATG
ncbi:MAG: Kelch repeat-containing protein, partial [Anaerolineales bacterium]